MYDEFLRNRLTELRIEKGKSERSMSEDLGHSASYVQSITSGKSLPSMAEFLYICEYFSITPKDFFDDNLKYPIQIQNLLSLTKYLNKDELESISQLIEHITKRCSVDI